MEEDMNSWTYRLVNSMASAVEWLLDEDPPSAASGPAPPVAPRKAEPPRPHLPPPAPGETAAELSEVALLERWRAHWRVAPLPPDGRVHRSPELTALVSAGVPATDRAAFWCACAGVDVVPGEYERLVTQALNGGASRLASVQIEKDLNRTFEGVASVRIPEAEAVGALRRVLSAFAVHDPVIGYTQSMNFLAAILLILMEEERAFWTLAGLCKGGALRGYYSGAMEGAVADQCVLKDALAAALPAVSAHLDKLGVAVPLVSTSWLLCGFVCCLRLPALLRVWDLLLYYDGSLPLVHSEHAAQPPQPPPAPNPPACLTVFLTETAAAVAR
mmetsp:Transcript_26585/g.67356  ORF Transcript_26585/g.67356 Transcript_26585/m.67356 type:complete len:330 (+) Transcript_26585:248-1237(+)